MLELWEGILKDEAVTRPDHIAWYLNVSNMVQLLDQHFRKDVI